ncbi:MAG: hypothetical protein M3Y54_21940 [Bacteroidota bacterium]|nr:hypothetical protein [Bacteroidota bacterium]
MRFLLLLLAIVSPLLGRAQAEFISGSYELANGTKGKGLLSYETGPKARLLVKDPKADPTSKAGQKAQEFAAGKVRAFTILGDQYVALHSITLDSGKPGAAVTRKNDFGKLVIDGRLELIEYDGAPAPAGTAKAASTAAPAKVYLLRRQGEDEAFSIPVAGKKYREMLTGFLDGRPDLMKKISFKPMPDEDLRELVKAYNSGSTEQ